MAANDTASVPDPNRAAAGEIQATILTSWSPSHAGYYLLSIVDPVAFRQFLLARPGLISMEADTASWKEKNRAVLLGFTADGLRRLDANLASLFPEAFAEGMASRAQVIGDTGKSAPEHWEGEFGSGRIHAVIGILVRKPQLDVGELWKNEVVAGAAGGAPPGTRLVGCCQGRTQDEKGKTLLDSFGFRDGISQPELAGASGKPRGATADVEDPIALGEFVLGYPDELDRFHGAHARKQGLPWQSAPLNPLLKNGSYMVLRKLRQDAAAFQGAFSEAEQARLMGRWKNGAPLQGPTSPPAAVDESHLNDFTYAKGSPEEQHVPRGSHIRQANPRQDPQRREESGRRHRIVRRGLHYRDGENDEGVLFLCFNARIDDQFEFIQSVWFNSGNSAGLPSDRIDPIGSSQSPYVTLRGGEYFFMPSRSLLQRIAAGDSLVGAPPPPEKEDRHNLFDIPKSFAARLLTSDAIARPVPGRSEKIYFVGRHERVLELLQNEKRHFRVSVYADRIADGLEGGRFLIGLDEQSPIRPLRQKLARAVVRPAEDERRVEEICRGVLEQHVEPRLVAAAPLRPIEVVTELARAVSLLGFVPHYLGIPVPETREPSPARVAHYFGRRSYDDVPPEWRQHFARKMHADTGDDPRVIGGQNFVFLVKIAFLHTFANAYGMAELQMRAGQAASELAPYVLGVIQQAGGRPPGPADTVLQRCVAQIGKSTKSQDEQDVLMLMLEVLGGGTETVVKGITNVIDVLISSPQAMEQASSAVASGAPSLDRVIWECLRLAPVSVLALRRCAEDSAIGTQPIERGSLVCGVIPVASRDPSHFVHPDRFDPTREVYKDLGFGADSHACIGERLALAQIRAVLRFLLGPGRDGKTPRFPGLRRAAGVKGQKLERFGLPESLHVRLDPLRPA